VRERIPNEERYAGNGGFEKASIIAGYRDNLTSALVVPR